MKPLIKYTNSKNIENIRGDLTSPYTFSDWFNRHIGISQNNERVQYEKYLADWYALNDENNELESNRLRNDYKSLLQQLTISFQNVEDVKWLQNIDWNDEFEIEQTIPYYVKKLKQIALYLINKRDAIKKAKLKYNMVGSNNSSIRLLYEYILKAFTKRNLSVTDIGTEYTNNITDPVVWNTLPDLSAAKIDFNIEVQDLYDDTNYFDRDVTIPVSSYFNLSASDVLDYFVNNDISIDLIPWLYSTGVMNVCADNPLMWSLYDILNSYSTTFSGVPISAVELPDSYILNDYNRINLTKKYLGSDYNIVSGGYSSVWVSDDIIPLKVGNNFFWWLSGEIQTDFDYNFVIDPISIHDTTLIQNNAKGSISYQTADRVFVRTLTGVNGAWLYYNNNEPFNVSLSCGMYKNRTMFYFPYPGYGVSGEFLDWSGKQLNNIDFSFNYMDKDVQEAVMSLYWATTTNPLTSLVPLSIHDTTLIENGATPSVDFNTSDYIIYRPNGPYDDIKNSVSYSDVEYAWLYKMVNTDIPVRFGKNKILWPFERYDNVFNFVVPLSDQCLSVFLNDIDISHCMLGAVAGYSIDTADTIMKIRGPNSVNDVLEMAWLSGQTITYSNLVSGVVQPGLSFACVDGEFATFIWLDEDTPANDVFKHYDHQIDCAYLNVNHHSIYKERPFHNKSHIDYYNWKYCTCRSIVYSPFGHPGTFFDDYERLCDFIIADNGNSKELNLLNWRDSEYNNIYTSTDFAWYNLTEPHIDPDVGWGAGRWKTAGNQQFILRKGVRYHYYRNNLNRDIKSGVINAPYFVIKYPYSTVKDKIKWINSYYDLSENEWKSLDTNSTMKINPGDYLVYDHKVSFSHYLSSVSYEKKYYNVYTQKTIAQYSNEVNSSNVNSVTTVENYDPNNRVTTTLEEYETIVNYITGKSYSVNFMMNVPLSGWNYTTNSFDMDVTGAKPYWAIATDENDSVTKFKGIDVWGGNKKLVDNYNFHTQPIVSNMVFELDSYFEYVKRGNNFTWIQPLTFKIDRQTKRWCKLYIDTSLSNIADTLYNIKDELVISGSYEDSDIVFKVDSYDPMFVNYYAISAFKWIQPVKNSNYNVNIDKQVGSLIKASYPYANLTNRHFPTIASFPYMGELYTMEDVGGYFVPSMIGINTYLGKYYRNVVNTNHINTLENRSSYIKYRDLNSFVSDFGLTLNTLITPVTTVGVDVYWLKGAITEGYKAGITVNLRDHQDFIPYQTTYELNKRNNVGLVRQGDGFDPWIGELDNTWKNEIDWPKSFKDELRINEWYSQFTDINNKNIHQFKSDIFGNQYFLVKDYGSEKSIYEKNRMFGSIWIRDARNVIKKIPNELIDNFKYFGEDTTEMNLITSELDSKVRDIDIWFDTFMIRTENYVFLTRINFDYETGSIYSLSDYMHRLYMNESEGQYFGGLWFFDDEKNTTICRLVSTDTYITPELYSLDFNSFNFVKIYSDESSDVNNILDLDINLIEDPILTYNKDLRKYSVVFECYSDNYISNGHCGMILVLITIDVQGDDLILKDVTTILPVTN